MKFSEMKYERYDLEKYRALYKRLAEQARDAKNAQQLFELIDEHEKAYSYIMTMGTLAHIRHTIDTTDKFYEKENRFRDESMPLLQEALLCFFGMLISSPFRPVLEEKYGGLIFKNIELEMKCFSAEIVPLLQKENALVSAYQKLTASAQIEFDGKTLTVSQMAPYAIDKDRSVRKAAYEALASF